MIKIEQLQLINKNNTADCLLRFLERSTAKSNQTNLDSFTNHLKKIGFMINKNDFVRFFVDLEEAGAGQLVPFRENPQGKFIWSYDLQAIADQALNPNKLIDLDFKPLTIVEEKKEVVMPKAIESQVVSIAKKQRGRPKGAKNKKASLLPRKEGKPVYSQQAPREILFIYTTKRGQMIPMCLEDVDLLNKQAEQIRMIS